MQELMLGRLFNSNSLLDAVFLAGMFAVIAFKKESITVPGLFRLAYWLFGLSIIVPACLTPSLAPMMASPSVYGGGPRSNEVGLVLSVLYSGSGPVLLALSVLCAMGSMLPHKQRPAPAAPAKHPLD